jgi:drug/metabolite transporter (DMT)-like permease
MGAGYLLQIYSINFTDVARASFLTGMCLIFIPFLNFLLFREIVKLHSLIGLILAVIGLYILLDPSFSGLKSGDIMGLAAMPLWALYMIYMSVFTEKEEGLAKTYQFLFWQLAGVLPVALITALIFESGLVKSLHPDLSKAITITPLFLIGLFFNAVLASVVTVLIQTYSQKHTTAIQAMICYQAEPITATLAAAIILGDRLTFNVVAGGLVIILAILISEAGGLLMERRKAA